MWEKTSEREATCFRCFKCLENGQYFVQSADFFQLPFAAENLNVSYAQLVELFIEEPIDERTRGFDNVEEAIENHKKEFER